MSLALFDMDNTLIAGDSDYEWGQWLVLKNKVDGDYFRRVNEGFFDDYKSGVMDINAYLEFALAPLARMTKDELDALHSEFMDEVIASLWLPDAENLLAKHRQQGDVLVIISATNRFVIEPICKKFGVDEIIATEPEFRNGRYTGKVIGTPSYREGKVERLYDWLHEKGESLKGSYFYSDSINDLSLLSLVDNPIAVDPDAELTAAARQRNWPIISLRDEK